MAFWGLVLEPKKQYSQIVEHPFHVSMAVLDLSSAEGGEEATSVILRREGSDFILCQLSKKHKIFNVPLNLDFDVGDELSFHVGGQCRVHLTGYSGDDAMEGLDSDESGEEEEEEEDQINKSPFSNTKKLLGKSDKRKADQSVKNDAKKAKLVEDYEDDEESDDSDFNMGDEDDEDDDEEEGEDEDTESSDGNDPEELLKKLSQAKKQDKDGKKAQFTPNDKKEGQQVGKTQTSPGQVKQKGKKQQQQQQHQHQKGANVKQESSPSNEKPKSNGVLKKFNEGGVFVEELCVGTGPAAKSGKMVTVYYVGRLKNNNKQFDATQSGPGFQFRFGRGEVIKGWDIGLKGMQAGGKRRISIPPKLAYGSKGSPPAIPPNSPLVFEVELKSVR